MMVGQTWSANRAIEASASSMNLVLGNGFSQATVPEKVFSTPAAMICSTLPGLKKLRMDNTARVAPVTRIFNMVLEPMISISSKAVMEDLRGLDMYQWQMGKTFLGAGVSDEEQIDGIVNGSGIVYVLSGREST